MRLRGASSLAHAWFRASVVLVGGAPHQTPCAQQAAVQLRPLSSASSNSGSDQTGAGGAAARHGLAALALLGGLGAFVGAYPLAARGVRAEQVAPEAEPQAEYTPEQVAEHRTAESRVWVSYAGGVYDITEFVSQHPGGAEKIMLAAGGPLEPFWAMFQQHNKAEIRDMLSQFRIGKLHGAAASIKVLDPYVNEPKRHPALVRRSEKPFNAETPQELLSAGLLTNNDIFYVRNHLPVPLVDPASYQLHVEGEGLRAVTLTLEQLKAGFKKHTVAATVECAGNRRNEMKAVKDVKGLEWDVGAIGTAVWGGVRLRDVLSAAGLDPDDPLVAHIHFVGLDTDMTGQPYACSIPMAKAVAAGGDVLLAYEMNGQPLPTDHGGPLRVVVPGVVGARNVKWLGRIVAAKEEVESLWQKHDYKALPPGMDWDTIDWESAPAIQELPVMSAICEPKAGDSVGADDGEVTARGYAWSGGGRDVVRVEVSADGGKSWASAQLKKLPGQGPGRAWAWCLWEVTLPFTREQVQGGQLELLCKATDEAYNTQPDSVAGVWNLRGLLNNAWHRVGLVVEP